MAKAIVMIKCPRCGREYEYRKDCCNRKEADSFEEWAKDNMTDRLCPACYEEEKKSDPVTIDVDVMKGTLIATGNTYNYKEKLRAIGFEWSGQYWTYEPENKPSEDCNDKISWYAVNSPWLDEINAKIKEVDQEIGYKFINYCEYERMTKILDDFVKEYPDEYEAAIKMREEIAEKNAKAAAEAAEENEKKAKEEEKKKEEASAALKSELEKRAEISGGTIVYDVKIVDKSGVCFAGNTYHIKDALKEIGAKYSNGVWTIKNASPEIIKIAIDKLDKTYVCEIDEAVKEKYNNADETKIKEIEEYEAAKLKLREKMLSSNWNAIYIDDLIAYKGKKATMISMPEESDYAGCHIWVSNNIITKVKGYPAYGMLYKKDWIFNIKREDEDVKKVGIKELIIQLAKGNTISVTKRSGLHIPENLDPVDEKVHEELKYNA